MKRKPETSFSVELPGNFFPPLHSLQRSALTQRDANTNPGFMSYGQV